VSNGIVIIGAGMAGARTIVNLRATNYDGPIFLLSAETHLPYDRPPLSKASITQEDEPTPVFLLDQGMLDSLKVQRIIGQASWIETKAKLVHHTAGDPIAYDKVLIATGAVARELPGAPHALRLRTFEDALTIRKAFAQGRTVAIIGGGFIGLELASSAAKRGCKVTVIESQSRVLKRGVTDAVAETVTKRHEAAGVEIIVNTAIGSCTPGIVTLKDGRSVPADVLIAGIGAAPNTDIASGSYLNIDNGVACDAALRTSDPDVFAAGDCCSFPHPLFGGRRIRLEAWRAAQDMGAIVAANMLGGSRTFEAVPWFWSDQFDLSLQIAGMPSEGTAIIRRQLTDDAFIEFHLTHDGRLIGASGIGPGNSIARDIKLAEMLIAKRASPAATQLADPAIQLKTLLKG
jgi:3-phenylpropionate/trans-cinnamate dioxygenase ferredoxin reductase component